MASCRDCGVRRAVVFFACSERKDKPKLAYCEHCFEPALRRSGASDEDIAEAIRETAKQMLARFWKRD